VGLRTPGIYSIPWCHTGNNPNEQIQHSNHGESLKSTIDISFLGRIRNWNVWRWNIFDSKCVQDN
jgi:hypothetical protein